jgi:hypothetical protein
MHVVFVMYRPTNEIWLPTSKSDVVLHSWPGTCALRKGVSRTQAAGRIEHARVQVPRRATTGGQRTPDRQGKVVGWRSTRRAGRDHSRSSEKKGDHKEPAQ